MFIRAYLAAHQYGARDDTVRVFLSAVVQSDDVQTVEHLALVLVDALDLHVKQ